MLSKNTGGIMWFTVVTSHHLLQTWHKGNNLLPRRECICEYDEHLPYCFHSILCKITLNYAVTVLKADNVSSFPSFQISCGLWNWLAGQSQECWCMCLVTESFWFVWKTNKKNPMAYKNKDVYYLINANVYKCLLPQHL